MRNLLFMLSCTIFFYVFVEVGLFQDNNILGKRFAQLPDVAQSIFAVMFYAFMCVWCVNFLWSRSILYGNVNYVNKYYRI